MAEQALPERAPDFSLDHVLGHSVSMGDFRGQTVVVVFGGRESAEQVKNGIGAIRAEHGPEDVPILAISDLEAVPRPARILVKKQLSKALQEATQDLTTQREAAGKPPPDPAKDILMLMDWKGEAVHGFGVSGVDKEAVAVVVDAQGNIVGSASGAEIGDKVLALLSSR